MAGRSYSWTAQRDQEGYDPPRQCAAKTCSALAQYYAGALENHKTRGIRRCSGPFEPRYGMLTASVLCRRQMVLKSGTGQSRPVSRSRLSTKPVVWRSAIPKSTFMVKQVWIAASLKVRDLPLLPEGLAPHFISGSNQIVSDPRRFSAAL